jgi:MATE family multidrug resistance protein
MLYFRATNFTRAAQFVFLAGYILAKKKDDQTWLNFSCKNMSYEVMQPFYALALPGTIATSAQMWMGEALTLLASALGTNALDAHTIVGNLCTFLFLSFPMAIGIGASIRVGQLIGSQRPVDAKKCFHASMFLCISTQSALIVSLYSCKKWLSRLFTNDDEVSSIALHLLSIMFIIMLGDTINVTIGGVLRGLGKQNWYLMSNLIPSWLFAIPMSIIFAFKMSLGIEGLWWGMLLGTYSSSVVGLIVMHWFVDWEDEAHQSLERLSSIGQLSTSSKMTSSLTSVSSIFTVAESF